MPVFREEDMVPRHRKAACFLVAVSASWLGFAASPALAQGLLDRLFHRNCPPQPCPIAPVAPAPQQNGVAPMPPAEQPGVTPTPPAEQPGPETTPTPQAAQPEPSFAGEQAFASGGTTINMLGDQLFVPLGVPSLAFLNRGAPGFPPLPGSKAFSSILVPAIRNFEISEDEGPRPQDRVYFGFNYFDNVNKYVNEVLESDLHRLRVYRETFGLEKTFLNGNASVGLRLPIDTLTTESNVPGLSSDDTAVGDLTVILKYAFWRDRHTGSLLSGGLAITTPTGPDKFAGSSAVVNINDTILQPYIGYYWSLGRAYIHGFSAIDVPTDSRDVTLLHNDIGIGYYLYQDRTGCRLLTAAIPTFEVHVNNPLNHRGATNFADPAGTPDWVDLTTGLTLELHRRTTLAAAFVTPVTGPKPFDFEVLVQLNVRFGCSAR
jgi:hypothetical protein